MIDINKGNYATYIVSLLGLILITYTSLRAARLSFTHDESTTVLWFVHQSFMEIISYHLPKAGNHIMNTLAIKLFITIFPVNDFFIRLPNLLAHAAYLIFSFLMLKHFKNNTILVFGFILLNCNPYMLDFFSLARGYGLSLAFMMVSIYYLTREFENHTRRNIFFMFLFASLSVLSNFVIIHYYLSLILAFNLIGLTKSNQKKKLFRYNYLGLITTLILGIVLFEPIRKLSKFKELYFGGNTGFYSDTVVSFINGIKYGQNYGTHAIKIAAFIILLFIIVGILAFTVQLKSKNLSKKLSLLVMLILFLFPVVTINVQHYLLGTKFIVYRSTLFFYPLLCLFILGIFSYFLNHRFKKYLSIVLGFLSVTMAYHSIRAANLTYASEWKYDANTKKMLIDLEEIVHKEQKNKKVT